MNSTMGSLFAGIGGFDLGFERAGFKTSWQVEIDPYCQKVLAKNFPEAERFGDIRECGSHNLKPVDVICGGFPCQDISNAGLRAGIEGERSGLWKEYARIIRELRPKYVVVENVAALLGRGMGVVLGDLAEIGYDAEWQIISAADMGALHLRERVWIVSYPNENGFDKSETFAHPAHNQERNDPTYREVGRTESSEIRASSEADIRYSQKKRFSEAWELRQNEREERIPCQCEARIFTDPRQERTKRFLKETLSRISGFSWCKDVRRVEDLRERSDIPEPLFCGSSDGIPNWVYRVGALGNAVVPQIPEMIARRIKQALESA